MSRRNLIVVSNRGPLSYALDAGGNRVVRRGGGGLVTALRGLIDHHDVTWIASAMSDEDRVVAAERGDETLAERTADGTDYRLRLVAHDPAVFDRFYNVVANGTLWFLHHYLWGLATAPDLGPAFREAWDGGYEVANATFADAVCVELARHPDAVVWFHDYHLYRAPALVRERVPEARLAHFMHIPWPQADYWHVLPDDIRRAVHEGLRANDVIGFHSERWRRSFLQACEAITGVPCPEEKVVARPISIDAEEFDALKTRDDVLAEERTIVASRPEQLIVRVDRTELSKNVVRGFRAYALLLEQHPELVGRTRLLALLDPSRQNLPEYAAYRESIEREAAAVDERFPGTVDLQIADNFAQSVAAYKQFDVLFVNPIFDGMNLIAKEGPLVNDRDGVLVLSENAGAHEELGEWALTVNPFDLVDQAEALYRALTMGADERRRRRRAIAAHVREYDVEAWTKALIADLDRVSDGVASER